MKKLTRITQLAFLKSYATDEEVLDIGAGKNPPYEKLFPQRIRLDIDKSNKPNIVGDIYRLPFPDNSRKTVLCLEVFEHLDDPHRAARELYRVLSPDGRLIFSTRFVYPLHDAPRDYWRYSIYILEKIFKDWQIEEVEYESKPFYTLAVILQRIGFQTEVRGGKITKAIIYALSWLFSKLDWLIKAEYGEIERTYKRKGVFSTGIYLVLRKSKKSN